MSATSPEQFGGTSYALHGLQEGRLLLAEQAAEREMLQLFNPDRIATDKFSIANVPRDHVALFDEGAITNTTLFALEAVGINTKDLLSAIDTTPGKDGELLIGKVLDNERLNLLRYGRGVSFRLNSVNQDRPLKADVPSEAIAGAVMSRLKSSPAYRAIAEAATDIQTAGGVLDSIKTKPFSYNEDPLGTLVFLNDIGLLRSFDGARALREGVLIDGLVDRLLLEVRPQIAARTQSADTTELSWGTRVQEKLHVNHTDGTFVFSAGKQSGLHYLEKANQAEVTSLPFIESECAAELTDSLDAVGLMFHPSFQQEMMQVGRTDRYGSTYTQLTREIAKWVDNPARARLSNLFVPRDNEFSGRELAAKPDGVQEYDSSDLSNGRQEATEKQVRDALATMLTTRREVSGQASATLINMIEGVLQRAGQVGTNYLSDLPVTEQYMNIRDGACFDVVAYYVGAAADTRPSDIYLRKIQVGNVNLLEKSTGSHTFLSTESIMFNGVALPKGSLFGRANDGGWAFLRLTPFTFDESVDQLAFGSELTKMFQNEERSVKQIGDIGLRNLVQAAL